MDINAGVVLVLLAILLFIAELLVVSFGLLTLAGIAALATGLWILFQEHSLYGASPWLIAIIVVLIAVFMTFAITRVIAVHKRQAYTGREELIGKNAVARTVLDPVGTVMYRGELWSAVSDTGTVEKGEEVTISSVEGMTLHVFKRT